MAPNTDPEENAPASPQAASVNDQEVQSGNLAKMKKIVLAVIEKRKQEEQLDAHRTKKEEEKSSTDNPQASS